MALATPPAPTAQPVLTYESYLAEGEVRARYDIIDGVRVFMPSPTRRRQRIAFHVARALNDYEITSGKGQMLIAPCDVFIPPGSPFRTRQPDVLFISRERLAQQGAPEDEYAPLSPAPELAIEILSPTESRRDRADKIADYQAAGVRECWVFSPQGETVEVLHLSPQEAQTDAVYVTEQTLRSAAFPDLTLPLADLFRE